MNAKPMTLKAQKEARIAAKALAKAEAAAAEQARITSNPIYAAIAPQRAACADQAAARVGAQLRKIAAQLIGSDLKVSAPRGDSFRDSRNTYLAKNAFYNVAVQVTARNDSGWPKYEQPVTGVNEEGIARLVAVARDEATASFDAYVAKLTSKVGACDSATVGGSLWQYSILTVTKGETVERWHTQQILNVSCLGTVFNQWPTRLLK